MMKQVRIKNQNIRRGDVFVAKCDNISCLVERPRRNMGKKYQKKQQKPKPAFSQTEPAAVDFLMNLLNQVM